MINKYILVIYTYIFNPWEIFSMDYIYICIYIYWQHFYINTILLNIIDIFCLHIFLLIRLYCRIAFIVFGID